MTCHVIIAGPDLAAIVCTGDLEWEWAMALCEEQRRAEELEQDLAIEAELGRWPRMDGPAPKVTDIEYVPVELAPVLEIVR